jgi:DNA polymerase II small subunit/DNA polymerase delta subunit B
VQVRSNGADNEVKHGRSNAEVASYRANRTRYALVPSVLHMDPFVITETSDIYAVGCQPRFATRLVKGGKRRCRVTLFPSFAQTGIVVLVGLRSLDVRMVRVTEDIVADST